jgi:Putative zinc-finger
MMDCDKFESAMMDELYGELDEVTSAAVKRHLAGCGHCATLFGGLRATRRVAVMPVVGPSPELERRILDGVNGALGVVPFRGRVARAVSVAGSWAMRPQTAMAAVFLVMLGASVLLLRGRSSRAPASAEMTVTQEGTPAPAAAPSNGPLGTPTDLALPTTGPLAANDRVGEVKAAAPPTLSNTPAQEPLLATPRPRAFAKAPPTLPGAEVAKASSSPAHEPAGAAAPITSPAAPSPGAAQGGRSAANAPAEKGESGDVGADLVTARSQRDARGCRAALARFDDIARRSAGTPVGWQALLEGAICYRSVGDIATARTRLNALLNIDSYKERARIELGKLDRMQGEAP